MGATFYGLYCLAAAAGFFLFHPLSRISGKPKHRKIIIYGAGLTGTAGIIAVPFVGDALVGLLSLLTMLTAGIVGASLLRLLTMCFNEKSAIGTTIAIPYCVAFLLQFGLEKILSLLGDKENLIQNIVIVVAFCSAFVLSAVSTANITVEPQSKTEKASPNNKLLISALVGGILVFCLFGLLDGIIMTLHIGKQISVYGFIRLFCVPGLLLAAWSFDYHGGKHFHSATFSAFVLAIAAVFLFNTAETYNIALASVYFLGSWMTAYSLMIFIKEAGHSTAPSFWSAAGRGMKYGVGGIFALGSSYVFANINLVLIALIYLLFLVALFLVFYTQGRLAAASSIVCTDQVPPSQSVSLELLVKSHGFTKRETEVLKLLLEGKSTGDIGAQMVIKEKTVQKYVSSMMEKCGAESRASLVVKFTTHKV